jgi:hypothetical protein
MDMMDRTGSKARARRQERIAKLVWGTLFLVMGVLFTLQDMGRIDLGEPRQQFSPARAVDGDPGTRWASSFRDGQWLTVDLGAPVPLGKVRLVWESAHARDYEVQLSDEGLLWTTARRVEDAHGGTEEQEISATARFVRVVGTRRATPYGVSLWELQVFDSSGNLVSQGKLATASSMEDDRGGPFALWLRFWPLLLVAAGLPLLLAPRDDTNQVIGIAMTAAGTLLQLQALGRLPWGIRSASAAVLICVGIVILLQSQRRSEQTDDGNIGGAA